MALSGKTKIIGVFALLVAVFLTGFIPGCLQEKRLSRELLSSQEKLQLLSLENDLAFVLIETEEKNFGNARDLAGKFFDRVRETVSTLENGTFREQLKSILDRRDPIISELTSLSPNAADDLRNIYRELHQEVATHIK